MVALAVVVLLGALLLLAVLSGLTATQLIVVLLFAILFALVARRLGKS